MIETYKLEQLIMIDEKGTLSGAAEALHISQPALSRSMKHLEEELQVSLFERCKNSIKFNENGKLAVDYARRIIAQQNDMIEQIRFSDRSRNTISIGFCAPAPLWWILPACSLFFEGKIISSVIENSNNVLNGLKSGNYKIAILPYCVDNENYISIKYKSESLYFTVPRTHRFADKESVTFADIDGENMLLYSQIGEWYRIPYENMPHSRFFIQTDKIAFDELVKRSELSSFSTNLSRKNSQDDENKVYIPITDNSATITFYIAYANKNKKIFRKFVQEILKD